MMRWVLAAALAVVVLSGVGAATPTPVAAGDTFQIVLAAIVPGSTTVSGAVRNVPGGTKTVKLELTLKSGDVKTQTLDEYTHGLFVFRDVPVGGWTKLTATALGGIAEQTVAVLPDNGSSSNGYGDGNYQGYQGPIYFPGYLGVNGSGYSYPGNYGYPSYGPLGNPGTYFYPGSYGNPGYYAYPGFYYYPGYGSAYGGYGGPSYGQPYLGGYGGQSGGYGSPPNQPYYPGPGYQPVGPGVTIYP